MDILIKLACRSRPEKCLQTMGEYVRLADPAYPIRFVLSLDADDVTMNNPGFLSKVQELGAPVRVAIGNSKTKIEACNADLTGEKFDILILAADDMVPVMDGYNAVIARDMLRLFPNLDGSLHYNDGFANARLDTLPIMGYNLYVKFGYIYHPDYISMFADNEYTDVLRAMNKLAYIPIMPIEHRHHAAGKAKWDGLLERNDKFWKEDEATYNRRKRLRDTVGGVAFDRPPVVLSICICALEERLPLLQRLLRCLNEQINSDDYLRTATEIHVVLDDGQAAIGTKRNTLLDAVTGRFMAYIDDDDMVARYYVRRIMDAIASTPRADVVRMPGYFRINDGPPVMFDSSLKYGDWMRPDHNFKRWPTHLNPTRTAHVRKIRFKDISKGDDLDYNQRMHEAGLLKVEAPVDDDPLYFYLFSSDGSRSQHTGTGDTRKPLKANKVLRRKRAINKLNRAAGSKDVTNRRSVSRSRRVKTRRFK